jgi:hypothetical protein
MVSSSCLSGELFVLVGGVLERATKRIHSRSRVIKEYRCSLRNHAGGVLETEDIVLVVFFLDDECWIDRPVDPNHHHDSKYQLLPSELFLCLAGLKVISVMVGIHRKRNSHGDPCSYRCSFVDDETIRSNSPQ